MARSAFYGNGMEAMMKSEILRMMVERAGVDVVLHDEEDGELDLEIDFHANGTRDRVSLSKAGVSRLYEALGSWLRENASEEKKGDDFAAIARFAARQMHETIMGDAQVARVRSAEERLERAKSRCSTIDLFMLRSIVAGWKRMELITLVNPVDLVRQLDLALDAVATVHGEEAKIAELDRIMEQVHGPLDASPEEEA